jgi:hypothetical protein
VKQLELSLDTRRRWTGEEPEIKWEEVSGLDQASNPRLLARWLHSQAKRQSERETRKWAANIKRRRIASVAVQ